MPEPLYRQYLSQATRLAQLDPRRPQQGSLRRALSTAYYAAFHYLIDRSCRQVVGTSRARTGVRFCLARAYEHNEMKRACEAFARPMPNELVRQIGPLPIHPDVRRMAQTFVVAQELRHQADYDLSRRFVRPAVLSQVDRVRSSISSFEALAAEPSKHFLLLSLLLWQRFKKG